MLARWRRVWWRSTHVQTGYELPQTVGDAENAHRSGRTETAHSAGAAAVMRELKRRTELEKARVEWVKPPGAADIAATVGILVHSLRKHNRAVSPTFHTF